MSDEDQLGPEAAPGTAFVLERCHALGFARAGVCVAEPSHYGSTLRRWLDEGRHGEMDYLARNVDVRLDPTRLLPEARSIVCVADRYAVSDADPPPRPGFGRVARYARGDDYHRVMKRRLHDLADELAIHLPGERFRVVVDTAPLLEREHAERAGLGAVGKHTLLIERGVGSYLLLGAVLTTATLAPTPRAEPDPCGLCTRCIEACPTAAITPWSVDATRCISYLTIEHRGPIDGRYDEAIGSWLFGCDVCQEVCPHNQPTDRSRGAAVHPAYEPRRDGFDLLEVLGWTEDDRRRAFTRSAMKRARLGMMRRNAAIVAANDLDRGASPVLRRRLEQIAKDPTEDAIVRDAARRGITRATSGDA